MPVLVPRYTAEEIRHFPDDRLRYEVIRGQLFMTSAPGTWHQRAVRELQRVLQDYLELHALGEAIAAPYEVLFAEDTAVQPDLIVIQNDRAQQLDDERFNGPPSLAVEVISYSSKRTDRLEKRALYQEEGIPEYWIVDPGERRVERWTPSAREPVVLTDRLHWGGAPGVEPLEIDLVRLFEKVQAEPRDEGRGSEFGRY
jgi:Uma2 family endonuclease